MSSDVSINISHVSKAYELFAKPVDRLKQMVVPRLQRAIGQQPKRYYSEFWALRDIDFTVRSGETLGIVGRNGSGKSTLLQIICGTLRPSIGEVTTHGRICALLELGAGFNPEFTGLENVLLSGQLLGLSSDEVQDILPQIEAFAEIGEFINHPVKTYSSGMFVRLAFATQAFVRPDILVIDEALAVGDARFQAKCLARLDDLRSAGTSILFVSHDIASVRRFCDRAVWIDQGRMRAIGDVAEVTSSYIEFVFAKPAATVAAAPVVSSEVSPAVTLAKGSYDNETVALTSDQLIGAPNHLPIRRWGSRPGLIRAALIMDAEGRTERPEVLVGEGKQVVIHVALPDDLPRERLSVSFALKNTDGTDLVIASTWDKPACRFSDEASEAVIRFKLDNMMNDGTYLLVATIEDRSSIEFHYYDFVEGAAYVRSVTPELRWGIYVPPVEIHVHERTEVLIKANEHTAKMQPIA